MKEETMLTAQALREIEERAEKATPGPWKTHLVDDTSVVTEDGADVCATCDSSQAEREDGYNVEYERMEADAAFIAHARTDIPALIADRKALVEVLRLVSSVVCLDTDEDNVGELARCLGIEDIGAVSGMCWQVRSALQEDR
jgi:hypothetical protein